MQHMSRTLPIMGAQFKQNHCEIVKLGDGVTRAKTVGYSERAFREGYSGRP
jgi:hypothetical protein